MSNKLLIKQTVGDVKKVIKLYMNLLLNFTPYRDPLPPLWKVVANIIPSSLKTFNCKER